MSLNLSIYARRVQIFWLSDLTIRGFKLPGSEVIRMWGRPDWIAGGYIAEWYYDVHWTSRCGRHIIGVSVRNGVVMELFSNPLESERRQLGARGQRITPLRGGLPGGVPKYRPLIC